ncbi:hypothetical protein LTR36_000831 [Oleoguttula mirabilis]|uniref:Heterokaryon incompatibility domain-containing protein n=1 Tax=Oleoguttula mirabilis TaxID=1507867 RepID=A0AAV9J3S4_9PEZI|nr:hypothetical protein LTR36_000831 [Oleoguttula mirabilis]
MADIYTSANRVCVWLGENVDNAHLVFDHIARWKARCAEQKARGTFGSSDHLNRPHYEGPTLEAYHDMIQRPWFSRTWIIQEICFSHSAVVTCGPCEEDWWLLCNRIAEYGGFNYHPLNHTTPSDRWRMLADRQMLISRKNGRVRKIGLRDVANILEYSNLCGAMDPGDKVYGILALFDGLPMSVDYCKNIADVYQEFTKAVISASKALSILHLAGTKRILSDLPSWVPDYSVTAPLGVMPDATDRSFMHGDTGNVGWHVCVPVPGEVNTQITLSGKMVGSIAVMGPELVATTDNIAGSTHFTSTLRAPLRPHARPNDSGRTKAFLSIVRWRNQHHFLEWYKAYGKEAFPVDHIAALQQRGRAYETHLEFEPSECVTEYASEMESACYGRAMFVTDDGTLGLAPPDARRGDALVFLAGGFCPFVLRRRQDDAWTLVGDCYLYGLDPFVLWDDESMLVARYTLR